MKLDSTELDLLGAVQIDEMWRHLEYLCTLDRTSGSPGELAAGQYLADALERYGCEVRMHQFDAYLSYPLSARLLASIGPDMGAQSEFPAKTRSFSAATGPSGASGEIIYVPGSEDMFTDTATADRLRQLDLRGKIVLSEGGGRDNMITARQRGAVAYIHLWPSDEGFIHEGIVTPIWGTPGPEDLAKLPGIPVIAVKRADGLRLKAAAAAGPLQATIHTTVETGWRRLVLPEAVIAGSSDEFVLVGGHLDSWHLGATDNASGNACCLELARVLQARRTALRRGVRIAWWPGHSTGRYAGSAWYCDRFWQELHDRCVTYINVDSPGALGAYDYSRVTAVAENADFAREVVAGVTGQTPEIERPVRAGDQSFWGPGVSSLFMLLSNRPPGQRAAVGGSGMGWWWHTEQDTIDKVEPAVLLKDTQIHLLATWRLSTAQRLPFKLGPLANELGLRLAELSAAAPQLSWDCLRATAARLELAATTFDRDWSRATGSERETGNRAALAAIRHLTPVSFSAAPAHQHGPATPTSMLPLLEPALRLGRLAAGGDEQRFWCADLLRRQNAIEHALTQATRALAGWPRGGTT